jgi:hypothetical protein
MAGFKRRSDRMMHPHKTVNRAAPCRFNRIQLKGLTMLAARPRRVLQLATVFAVLNKQLTLFEPIPKKLGVFINTYSWS